MNNVNDLNKTDITKAPPTQTVSFDTVRRSNTSSVNINTINGLSGVEENRDKPINTVRINPNLKKKPRRTVEKPSDVQQINPNDYIPKESKPQENFINTVQSNAMTQLDAAVRRKQQEFRDFVEYAENADKVNRERIENGLEEVEGEIQYLPNDLPQNITKDPNPGKPEVVKEVENTENDDIEKDIENELNSDDYKPSSNVTVDFDPFKFSDDEHKFVNPYSDDNLEDEDFDEDDDMLVDDTIVDSTPTNHVSYNSFNSTDDNNNDDLISVSEQINHDTTIKEDESSDWEDENVVEGEVSTPVEENKMDVLTEKDEEIRNTLMDKAISVSSQVTYDTESTKETIAKSSSSDFDIDEEDFDDVDDSGDAAETAEDATVLSDEEIESIRLAGEKNLRNEILQKIVNTGRKLGMDTSQFTVSKKVISIKDAMKNKPTEVTRTAKWPMMYAERPFIASALKGPEIALLFDYDDSANENSIGINQNQLRIMYEHDANEYKPATIENWAKTIPFLDIESIFAALFVASMKGANYMPMSCRDQKCQHQYLTEDTDISKIVKFTKDEIKEKFDQIMKTPVTADNTTKYDSVVSVINDQFAIGLKIPSIFTMVYELNSVDRPFIEKYNTVISIIQYIDYIYKINPETMSFEPIGWKAYVGNYCKTFKSKIATYAKILKDFDSTEFSVLIALINSMLTKATDTRALEYEIPAGKCPKCGSDIPATPLAPRQLLFMRQRLVELATTPTER